MGWLGKPSKANATQTGVRANRGDSLRDQADHHLIQGVAMANAGRWDEALILLRAAAELVAATTGAESLESARVLHNLANVHWMKGDRAQAIELYRRSLAMRRRHLGSDHPDTLVWSRRLLPLLEAVGAFEEARDLADDLVARIERWEGDSPSVVLSIRVAHARLRWNTPQGEVSFQAARRLAEARPDPASGWSSLSEALDWAEALEGLAALEEHHEATQVARIRSDAEQAGVAVESSSSGSERGEWMRRRAYETRRAIGLEDSDSRQMAVLTRLVETARRQRRWEDVVVWGGRVLAAARSYGVASSPAIVAVIEALIAAEHARGRPASARSLAWIHLQDRLAPQGVLDLQRLRAPLELALCCWAAGDLESARDWFATLRDRLDAASVCPPDADAPPSTDPWAHARFQIWSGLGRVAWELGEVETARDAFNRALELQNQGSDPHAPDRLNALERLAWAHLLAPGTNPDPSSDPAGLFDHLIEARRARVEALEAEIPAGSPGERDTRWMAWAMALEGRIAVHLRRGEVAHAETLAQRLAELMSRNWGASGLPTLFVLLRLARRFAEVGAFDQARRWLNHLGGDSARGDALLAMLPALPTLPRRAIGCEADRLAQQLARVDNPAHLPWINDWRVAWKGAAREAAWIQCRLSDHHRAQRLQWLKARVWIEDRHARLASHHRLASSAAVGPFPELAEETRRLRDAERRAQRLIRDWRRSVGWPETPPTASELAAVLPDETVFVDLSRVASTTRRNVDFEADPEANLASDADSPSEPHLVAFVTRRDSIDLEGDDAPFTSATVRIDLGPAIPLEHLARRWLESLNDPSPIAAAVSTSPPATTAASIASPIGHSLEHLERERDERVPCGNLSARPAALGLGLVPWAAAPLQTNHRVPQTNADVASPEALAWALAVGLWAPLAGLVCEAETVLIAPPDEASDPWLVLPWADLPDPTDPDRQPLGRRQTVVVVPSARRVASWSFRLDGAAPFDRCPRPRTANRHLEPEPQGRGLLTVAAPQPSLRSGAGTVLRQEGTPHASDRGCEPSPSIPHASLAHASRQCFPSSATPPPPTTAKREQEWSEPTAAFDSQRLLRQLHYRPGSQAEAMMLANAARKAGLEGPIVELRGGAARREAILGALAGKRYVHLALPAVGLPWRTHGPDPAAIPWSPEFEPTPGRPLAALVASGAADAPPDPLTGEPDLRPYLITAEDLAACDLGGCDLVVLSIWFHPEQPPAITGGVASDLMDALVRAGARRVLLSSSPAPHDATIGFLGRLAEALWSRGLPVPQAVRHAQQTLDAPLGDRGRRSLWTLLVNHPDGLAPAGPASQCQPRSSRGCDPVALPLGRGVVTSLVSTTTKTHREPPALSRPE